MYQVMGNNGAEELTTYQIQPDIFRNNSPCSIASAVTTWSTMAKDLEYFRLTGNCVPPQPPGATSFNPTLFSLEVGELNKVVISGNLFEAYLPVPFEEQLAADFVNNSEDACTYCKGKLKLLIANFKVRKHRVSFHCHFGDCLDLCLWKDELKKKFQVIHCSFGITSRLGITNLISSKNGMSGQSGISYTHDHVLGLHSSSMEKLSS